MSDRIVRRLLKKMMLVAALIGAGCENPSNVETEEADSQRTAPGSVVEMDGRMIVTNGRNIDGTSYTEYHLVKDGVRTRLQIDRQLEIEPNTFVRVSGTLNESGKDLLIESIEEDVNAPQFITQARTVTPGGTEVIPVALIMLNDSNLPSGSRLDVSDIREQMMGPYIAPGKAFDSSLKAYLEVTSFDSITIESKIFVANDIDMTSCDNWNDWVDDVIQELQDNAVRDVDDTATFVASDYESIIGFYKRQAGGCSLANGSSGPYDGDPLIIRSWSQDPSIIAHEFGHNLGLAHASSYKCRNPRGMSVTGFDCMFVDYEDPFDCMGYGNQYYHFNSHYKALLGWLDTANIHEVTATGSYVVVPQEAPSATGIQSLLIPIDGTNEFYHVEFRQQDPNSFDSHAMFDDAVLVRRVWNELNKVSRHVNLHLDTNRRQAVLGVGETFSDPLTGISIHLDRIESAPAEAYIDVTLDTAPCYDGVQNGDESDVDCGFSCELCIAGDQCNDHVDCESANCVNGVCRDTTGGLTATYRAGGAPKLVETDHVVDFDWGLLGPPEAGPPYAVRWEGWLTPEHSEAYRFYTNASNWVRVVVDGTALIDNTSATVTETQSAEISLDAGRKVPILVEYESRGNPAVVQLLWSSGSQPKQVIPRSRFTPLQNGLVGEYFNNTWFGSYGLVMTREDREIGFDWGLWGPEMALPHNDFSVRWTGRIMSEVTGVHTFSIKREWGEWVVLKVDGQEIINWAEGGADTPSGDIHLTKGRLYEIQLDFVENSGPAVIKLYWQTPAQAVKEIVPATALFPPFDQGPFAEDNGLVVMEAESYDYRTINDDSWESLSDAAASGGETLISLANDGTQNSSNYKTDSPALAFTVDIEQAMTAYYVWVRGRGETNGDDTVHVGVDEGHMFYSENMAFSSDLEWHNTGSMDVPAQLVFDTAGVKTIMVWMAEDGFEVDKILLTTDADYTPTGKGPAESDRVTPCTTHSQCNDGNVCTDDLCVDGLCEWSDNTGGCADEGDPCTDDVCSEGACTHPDNGSCQGGPCDGICENPELSNLNQNSNIGTGELCIERTDAISSGNCGNFAAGRTLSVNGVTMPCNWQGWTSVPAPIDGSYCIHITAGDSAWAGYALW